MSKAAISDMSRFLRWWGDELRGLVPGWPGGDAGAAGRGDKTVVALGRTSVTVVEERGRSRRTLAAADLASGRPATEALHVLDGLDIRGPLGVRVAREACFARTLEIPSAALADAASLAALDLERATPFRAADVYTAVLPDPAAPAAKGRTAIRQLVLKRETVRGVLAALEARGHRVAFVDCWAEDGSTALPVDFLAVPGAAAGAGARGRSRLHRALATASLAAAAAALVVAAVKYDNALAVLDRETTAARKSAAQVNQGLAGAEVALADAARLRAIRSARPLAVAVLDEVTRLLPDDAYLTELTLDGDQVDLAGFARSAAPLVERFERSPLFTDARFSAPSRLEAREDRERFAMRVRLRILPSKAEPAAAPPTGAAKGSAG